MSTPTEPGTYWWKQDADCEWRTVIVSADHAWTPTLYFRILGLLDWYHLDFGIFGPRIPDPDEPRAEPAGGLTLVEADELYQLAKRTISACTPRRTFGDRVWQAVADALSAELARIGFTRLTDAEIAAGIKAASHAIGPAVTEGMESHSANNQDFCAFVSGVQVAAFRRTVAEAREAGK